jgi:hypothetical protein
MDLNRGRSSVIAGLDPAIHPLRKMPIAFFVKKMDPRVKPAGDSRAANSVRSLSPPELGLARVRHFKLAEVG